MLKSTRFSAWLWVGAPLLGFACPSCSQAGAPAMGTGFEPDNLIQIVAILRKGKDCLNAFPTNFNRVGLGENMSNERTLGHVSIMGGTWCTANFSPYHHECIVNGPGGAALTANGMERPLYYVPTQHIAYISITADSKECHMLSAETSGAGKRVARMLFREQSISDLKTFSIGINALRNHSYSIAAGFLQIPRTIPEAGYLSGIMADRGIGLVTDHKRAAFLLGRSAMLGYYPAQLRLGEMYRDGTGVKQDQKAASYWLGRARLNPRKTYSLDDTSLDEVVWTNPRKN